MPAKPILKRERLNSKSLSSAASCRFDDAELPLIQILAAAEHKKINNLPG
jgi:hypothetical protein